PIIYDDDYIIEKFATGLQYPTTMYFVGDDILVLEKNTGKVIRISDNGVLYNEPALDVPVIQDNEAGLLGIVYLSNHVYLSFTESLSGFDKRDRENARNAVYQYDWNGEKLTNPILIKELPGHLSSVHHGGIITTSLNNEIYFVIGEQEQRTTFQNIPIDATYETGSIFKIDTESKNSVELFAMGIRNSFGLAVDPVTGYLWDTENGIDKFDEINLVKPGFNSGWISIMGPSYRVDADLSTLNQKPFENFVYSDPEFSWHVTVAPTAIAFPDKDSFDRYSDWLFVGDYNNGRIYNFQLNSDRTGFVFYNQKLSDLVLDDNDEVDEILFAKGFQGVTDIKFHDGAMYVVVIGDGSIYKISPKNILPPLKQYQNNVAHKKIVCKTELMPIMNKSGYIYCVYPKTAITLNNVLNWSVDHPEIPKIELRFQDLSGLNFEYINLSNSDFRWSNFDTAKISNVDFTRANLSYTDLSGKDMTGTILTGAIISYTNFTGVDLSGKDLTGTILKGVDLSNVDLSGTILTGADLSHTNLTGVDLSGKDLTGTRLAGVDLSGKDLTGTILTGSDLLNVDLTGTILTRADLSHTNLTGVDLSDNDLTQTILRRADLSHTNFAGVDLIGVDLTGARLVGVDLSGKDLTQTILINANLENVTLKNAKLLNANLDSANLTNADLRNTLLVDTNLSNAILTGSDLTNAVLTRAILTGADLENAILTNAILTCVGHPICIS
ncbi:MAG: pentapeptide repeat-containing protein, partial [Gammaproteobacteria bacterium]|nr:pentapeptide repeat-containing protein [Gammaproteobacteria bacterium]